jgi:predicted outer membrane repeat protein
MRRSMLPLFVFALLLLLARVATACTANPYVGDTGSDSMCTDNDIQSAIDNACTNATIVITAEHTYTDQALTLNGKSLTLIANGGQCGTAPPPTSVPLAKLGGQNGHSVLWITGASNVTLQNLEITGGCSGSQCSGGGGGGGGIEFQGQGSLTLDTVTVDENEADYGAGVDVSTSGGDATLTIGANTLISYNHASQGGGGIHLVGTGDGKATLTMSQPTLILSNDASYGGGLNIVGDAIAYIGSPGLFGLGVIYGNTADYGGGLAATADGDGGPLVYLYSTDADHPVTIQGNAATQQGGAIYAAASASSAGYTETSVALWDYQLTGNLAAEGAAIYGHSQSYTAISGETLESSFFTLNGASPPTGAVRCTPSLACNSISGNIAQDGSGNPTSGSTIFLEERGSLSANRLIMRGNQGQSAVLGSNSNDIELQSCLIADNSYTAPLIHNEGDDSLLDLSDAPIATTISNCTLANNALGDTSTNPFMLVIYNYAGEFTLQDSIIDEGAQYNPEYSSGDPTSTSIHYILSRYPLVGITQQDLVQGTPLYVNATAGDYHLLPTSPGVDFAPAIGGTDLDGNPRDIDLPDIANTFGIRDLGAYETQNETGFIGICGSDNGQALPAPPTRLCNAGLPSAVTSGTSGEWNWTCAGTDDSTAAQCSATVAAQILALDISGLPTTGAVGTAYTGTVVVTNISDVVSLSGSATASISGLPPGLSLSSVCNPAGLPPGASLTCTVTGTPTTPGTFPVSATAVDPNYRYSIELDENIAVTSITSVNGVCGSDNGKTLSSPPTNLCNTGTPSTVSGSGPWSWTCVGSNGGTTANCSTNTTSAFTTPVPAPTLNRRSLLLLAALLALAAIDLARRRVR